MHGSLPGAYCFLQDNFGKDILDLYHVFRLEIKWPRNTPSDWRGAPPPPPREDTFFYCRLLDRGKENWTKCPFTSSPLPFLQAHHGHDNLPPCRSGSRVWHFCGHWHRCGLWILCAGRAQTKTHFPYPRYVLCAFFDFWEWIHTRVHFVNEFQSVADINRNADNLVQ